jgi:hypothetical protein
MARYNIFNLIHKGLRASLHHTSLQLQQTDFTSGQETDEALNRVREIVMLFEEHAHKEDSFILPAISQYEPSVTAGFEEEHIKDEELGRQLQICIIVIEKAESPMEKLAAGKDLITSFEAFAIFNLQHMAREESLLNKILWRYYNDDEIRNINSGIVRNVAPWIQDFYATWILRGINNGEASTWMKEIKKDMPPVVFKTILQKAEMEIPQPRLIKIKQTLAEAVMAAQ